MSELALVMPMAPRGARVMQDGVATPAPLVELHGHPAFWWAMESVRRAVPLRELVFVVLAADVAQFRIDERIIALYPDARVVSIPEGTTGAADIAAVGARALATPGPFVVNDYDHAFDAVGLEKLVRTMAAPRAVAVEGALLGYRSDDPTRSYVRFDASGMVAGTVERRVVSPFAIAGCYLFSSVAAFIGLLERDHATDGYRALSMSAMYDLMIRDGGRVAFQPLVAHVQFGRPEEMARVTAADLARMGLA